LHLIHVTYKPTGQENIEGEAKTVQLILNFKGCKKLRLC
jgi:hypothetical protein